MIILAIDPSINHTGWAVLKRGNSAMTRDCDWAVNDHGVWSPKDKDPYDRLYIMTLKMREIVAEHGITTIVIETTSGKVGKTHKGGGSGLALYGVAVGGLVMAALERQAQIRWGAKAENDLSIYLVTENRWTAGIPKAKRHAATLAEFGLPEKTTDHETDAIALGAWWHANRKILEAERNEACQKPKKPSRAKTKVKQRS